MNMNWLQSILFGLVSGLSEFLPISSRAHSDVLLHLFGLGDRDPVMLLIIHVAMLLALFGAMRPQLDQFEREKKLRHRNRKRQDGQVLQALADRRVVNNAIIPMLILMILLRYILRLDIQLPLSSLLLLINGIILYLPERMMQGNKDASGMSQLDSYLLGLAAALCVLSGFSGVGLVLSVALFRGADRQKAWNWTLLLMFPALAAQGVMDIIDWISGVGAIAGISHFFHYLLGGVSTYFAAWAGILLMKRLIRNGNPSVFAYYSWGAALFSFLLYLSVI